MRIKKENFGWEGSSFLARQRDVLRWYKKVRKRLMCDRGVQKWRFEDNTKMLMLRNHHETHAPRAATPEWRKGCVVKNTVLRALCAANISFYMVSRRSRFWKPTFFERVQERERDLERERGLVLEEKMKMICEEEMTKWWSTKKRQ